jgi:UDP:flavonoid glycosyltransferase YjiC (YdhE family)
MASLVICSTPVHGHVTPLLSVARHLVAAGHDVRFLTGARYREAVEAVGAQWLALPAEADYDDRDMDAAFPERVGRSGVDGVRWDLGHIFLEPAPAQLAAVDAAIAERSVDVVLAESLFFGAMLLLGRPRSRRPAVVNLGIVPLGVRSRDTAPFGLGIPPRPGALGRARNALLRVSAERILFGGLHREARRMMAREVGGHLATHVMDYPSAADAVAQFTVAEFEYPRSDLRVPVHFVGPVSRSGPSPVAEDLPDWWDELSEGRPVVHVTQGTVANADLDALVFPTMEALADSDVLVVATTGGRPVPGRALPGNARIAPYLPYGRLLPLTSAYVTNGGYGGVHFALEHGVPIVTTGSTEDKAEVSARVAWSGAGIRLRPRGGVGTPDELRAAVERVLTEPSYRANAARIGAAIRRSPGPAGLEEVLADLVPAAGGFGSRTPVLD